MKRLYNLRKSVTLFYLGFLILVSLDMILENTFLSWEWIGVGIITGLAIEVISNRIGEKSFKKTNIIETILLIMSAFLLFYSQFVPESLGIAVGIIIPAIVRQIIYQVYRKKLITWKGEILL